ncbi:hypothetical protein L3X38_037568 [Prunus dulcis]|uniref:Uncharacterized protein n=1 Tax=Prunus dulcis TaxID=3755 RepID=A0AAD4V4X6_PRUDU|nr:hypothetical protein L3X38_037568 [Prunus dulcis]
MGEEICEIRIETMENKEVTGKQRDEIRIEEMNNGVVEPRRSISMDSLSASKISFELSNLQQCDTRPSAFLKSAAADRYGFVFGYFSNYGNFSDDHYCSSDNYHFDQSAFIPNSSRHHSISVFLIIIQEIREDGETTMEGGDTVDGKNNSNIDGMSMDKDNYERLLSEAQRELYPGCTEYMELI